MASRKSVAGGVTATGLVLQGGGALGAFECGVVDRLYAEGIRPDVIAGVSIGAINAACLAGDRERSTKTMKQFWETVKTSDIWKVLNWPIGCPRFYLPRWDYYEIFTWTGWSDVSPIRGLLPALVDFEWINSRENPVNLVLSAAKIQTAELEYFTNKDTEDQAATEITPDHVLASGSLPPGLPITKIGSVSYWDGGLVDNTPLGPVMERLRELPARNKRAYVICLFPAVGEVPCNMSGVYDRMYELQYCRRIQEDRKQAERINEYLSALRAALETGKLPEDESELIERVLEEREVIDVKEISFADNGPVGGPTDFSCSAIEQRIEAGREAAQAFIDRGGLEQEDQLERTYRKYGVGLGAARR